MSEIVSRRDRCRVCGGEQMDLVLSLAPTPAGGNLVSADMASQTQESYPLDMYLCRDCGSAPLLDAVDPEVLYVDSTEATTMSLGMIEHLAGLSEYAINVATPSKNALVVDIGSNDGTYLGFFQRNGCQVLGVEPSQLIASRAAKTGIETIPKFFNSSLAKSIKDERGPAAIVTANRVMANIDDLADFVTGVRTLLAEDGVFIFETLYLLDLIEHQLIDSIHHAHLETFSLKALLALFQRNGMELVNAERVTVKGGSLLCTVQLAGGSRPVNPSVAKLLQQEDRFGLSTMAPFKALSEKIGENRSQLVALLQELKADGKTIAAYGASVGCITLIEFFGIGGTLEFLVDDDSRNHQLITPGDHLPVYSPQAFYDQNTDYVIILAWRYADTILKSHQAYIEKGGRFILPFPTVSITPSDK